MERGFLKLWRCTLDTDIWSNESLWRLWSWCLLKASYKERWVPISTGKGTTEVHLLPGQFIFGRKTAAKELKWTESTLYKRLQKLKTLGNCNIESNTHYSIVTICKWSTYQPLEKEKEQAKEQAGNRQGTGKEHKQECKEGIEGKEIKNTAPAGQKKPVIIFSLSDIVSLGVSEPVANDFIFLRKSKRAPLTQTAWKGIAKEIEKAGMSIEDGLSKMIERGWVGFEAKWLINKNFGKGNNGNGNTEERDANLRKMFGANKITGDSFQP